MGRYNVGDMVRIREDLKKGINYSGWYIIGEMHKYLGEVMKICNIYSSMGKTIYELNGLDCIWTESMLEPVKREYAEIQPKELIKIVEVEYKPNGERYNFIAEGKIVIGNFVVCDTKRESVYGRVVSSCYKELTKEEINQYKTCKAF